MESPLPSSEQSQESVNQVAKLDGDKERAKWPSRVFFLVGMTTIALLEHYAFLAFGLRHFEISIMAQVFQPLVRSGFPRIRPGVTTILRVDAPQFQIGPGTIRKTLADLLPKVIALEPKVIVIDSTLQELRTSPDENYDPVTLELLRKIRAACAHTPIILGFDVKDQAIQPHVSIYTDQASYCDEGYTNAENNEGDFRLVPLRVEVDSQKWPSLSYAAARAYRLRLTADERIQDAWRTGVPFYVPLFDLVDYADLSVNATEVLSDSLSVDERAKLKGSVLIIGFSRGPSYRTPAGRLPAYLLHAAYIEAFVSGWLLKDAPGELEALLTVLFIVAVAWPHSLRDQAITMAGIICLLLLLDFLLIRVAGLYTDLAVVSTLGVALWPLNRLHEFFHRYR